MVNEYLYLSISYNISIFSVYIYYRLGVYLMVVIPSVYTLSTLLLYS
jgi:hypothetical protein